MRFPRRETKEVRRRTEGERFFDSGVGAGMGRNTECFGRGEDIKQRA